MPPQNVELEMAVLGGIMLEPQEAYPLAADMLSRDSFYLDGHGILFEIMGELFHRGIPPDAQSVLDELRARSLLERVGGSGVVMGMLNAVPTAANVEYHARKIGEKAQLRAVIRGCTKVIEEAYKQELTVERILDIAESTVLQLSQRNTSGEFLPIAQVLQEYWEKLSDRDEELARLREQGIDNPRISTGLPTGFADLDEKTNGLRASELSIIAARPSVGKTALALNFAHNLAVEQGLPTALFSLEMGAEQLAERMLCIGSKHISGGRIKGIGSHRLQNPDLDASEWSILTKSYQRLSASPLYIDDSSYLTISMLKSKCRRLAAHYGVRCIVIDYLQLMSGAGNTDNRVQEVSEISRGLKQIARELKIPVIALSQLSRQVTQRTSKRPQLSDLRESGSIEQDADVVMFIHRDDYYEDKTDKPTSPAGGEYHPEMMPVTEIIVAKNRNGPTGVVKLLWFPEITRFLDVTQGWRG